MTTTQPREGRTLFTTGSALKKEVVTPALCRKATGSFCPTPLATITTPASCPKILREQARQMVVNVKNALEGAGATSHDVVRTIIFCPRQEHVGIVLPIIMEFLDGKPALTLTRAPLAADNLWVEMEITAKRAVRNWAA